MTVMPTAERVSQYFDFSDDVLASVTEAAERQNCLTFKELVMDLRINEGPLIIPGENGSKPIEVLEFKPKSDYDERYKRVLQTPFGSSIDECTVWQAARVFGADPTVPLVLQGGPSSEKPDVGRLTLGEIGFVAITHNLRPTVDPLLRYLKKQGVTQTEHMGYSAGSDKAATAIQYSDRYDQEVITGVLIEPATVLKRSLLNLTLTFIRSGKPQRGYIDKSGCSQYIACWDRNTQMDFIRYCLRLGRLSNLAVATALSRDGFAGRLDATLASQPNSVITVGWGTKSELTDNPSMERIVSAALQEFGSQRLHCMPLRGMYHAGMDDLDLYAAMMLQGLRNGATSPIAETLASPHSTDLDRVV